ncbi:MAG TPA: NAD(P)/FAD-dependent oxidoreductase [Aliidongia sp.]|uniref:NAD(P)/FAD-dependent oxidoreductase n=1 Tax=Aliidongia sp. TaxID=1914230 RepID=UPI002DDDBAD4|nr:NAD(P)/FAD-dependent oxidoreductase [Aliidongia sp.]HEV2676287.1 NAD(P)/FAD-dependent oxidoreductase [Aliidongia sp.]
MTNYDVVIIGAGAAGLMCALSAGGRGRRVLLIDHADEAGKKILISGGGRCNFTNRDVVPDCFLSANPHFVKSALKRYSQHDFIALVEKHRIPYHERNLGQLFCDGSAREILAMLLAECAAAGVQIWLDTKVTAIDKPERFRIETDRRPVEAEALVLATGGLSIPKMGATGFAHDVARKFGLKMTQTRPALVPLTVGPEDLALMQPLAGVSLDTMASREKRRFREAMLFTHRGLSGPVILQISSYWQPGETILLDLLPDLDLAPYLIERKKTRPKAELKTVLTEILPGRLALKLVEDRMPNQSMATYPDKALLRVAEQLKRWPLKPAGTEGYAKAEVTSGGIDTDGLSSQTLGAKAVPGLHAIGEAVDVTGWLGGYNFQWAWSSGWCAGQAV